jgi:hypothetical protein
MHGFVTWAVSSVLGLLITIGIVTTFASAALHSGAVALNMSGAHVFAAANATPAQAAAEATGAVLLAVGISLAASLIVSLLGGAIGVHRMPRAARAERDRNLEVRLPAAPPDAPNETTVPVVPR